MLIVAIATIGLVWAWNRESVDEPKFAQISPLPEEWALNESPIETPTPEVFPTVTPVPTLPFVDKLPPGEKVIYTETDETLTKTLVQLSAIENLDIRRRVTTIPHQFGYKPTGAVSPDRTRIAFLVKPELLGLQKASSSDGNQLWIVEINDGSTKVLADNVSYIAGWATNEEVAFARMASPVSPKLVDAVHPEFYTATLDGSVRLFLTGDQTGAIVHPVGWSQDGRLFYFAKWEVMPGAWEILEVEVESQITRPILKAMTPIAESPVLSANRDSVLYTGYTDSEQLLITAELASGNTDVLISTPRSPEMRDTLMGIPSLSDDKILIRAPISTVEAAAITDGKAELHIAVHGTDNQPGFSMTTVSMIDDSIAPIAWSPSEQWIAMTTLPHNPSIALIYSITQKSWLQIPKAYPNNWISVLGWHE